MALNNAAVAYENVQRYDSAMKLYQRVYKEHPKDPLASYALYRVAVNQERFFDFTDAVQSYELFYEKYDDSKQTELDEVGLSDFKIAEKRGDALRSAAVLEENLQRYPQAARGYERFAREYPDSDQTPEAAWQAVLVWEKAGEKRKMVDAIETFISNHGSASKFDDRVMGGMMKIADYHEERGSKRNADKQYERILEAYPSRGIQAGTPAAANAAKSRFMLAEREFEEWDKIQIKGSLRRQEKLLNEKIEKQQALTASYEEVFQYGSFDWTLAANYRVGNLLQRFAFTLYEVPIPFEEGTEESDIYRTQLEDIAIPLEDKAIERYEKNIAEARDKKVVNAWTKRTLEELNKYKPGEYPLFKEERRTIDEKTITGDPYISAEEWQKRKDPPAPKKESK
jgi:TolA-binding protein